MSRSALEKIDRLKEGVQSFFPQTDEQAKVFERVLDQRGAIMGYGYQASSADDEATAAAFREIADGCHDELARYLGTLQGDDLAVAIFALGEDDEDGQ